MLNVIPPYYVYDISGKFVKIGETVTNLNPFNSTSGGLAWSLATLTQT
jgi:hypothetical protein